MTTQSATSTPKTPLSDEQLDVICKITAKFTDLRLEAQFVPPVDVGPIVSVYRYLPTGATRVSHLEGMAADFAVTLGVEDVFCKRLPGESSVGIFVPNKQRKTVSFLDTIQNVWKVRDEQKIPLNFGVDYLGKPYVVDLVDLPHLLVCGSTGSGKSTLLDSIVASLTYSVASDKLRLVLSDTKNVEFTHFAGLPHLLYPTATTVLSTLERLEWLNDEMESRLKKIGAAGFRNVHEYNVAMTRIHNKLPLIVFIIDELADILSSREKHDEDKVLLGKIAEHKLAALVQKSRAAGVYVIAGTQRPSVNIVSGSIKANFPARLTFRLPSETDSRTVLGTGGAEHLLSQGDMLYVSPNKPGLSRLHAPYASISDIKAAVEAISRKEGQ